MKKQIDSINVETLTIGDEYLFETILLENKELAKELIGKLIEVLDIEEIEYISTEDNQQPTYENRGVRFDVYIKSQTGVAYIVELQRKDTKQLRKRARYYQAVSDSRQLPKGKWHEFESLKDNYVIFICREDVFGLDYYKYSFENTCFEVEGLKLQDGTHKIFFNTQGTKGEICEDIKAFLKAIEGQTSDNLFVKKLETVAEEIKADEMWREAYMQSLLRERDTFNQGKDERTIEIIEAGLINNVSIETISLLTSLSIEEIEALRKELLDE